MRELKFRRALLANGVFSHFKYWGKDIDHAVFVTPGPGTGYEVKDDQQFTGLDKNGKEIYEGDILLDQYEEKQYTEKWEEEGEKICKIYYPVIFKDGCLGWIGENSGTFYPFCDHPIPETIVLGNIYEHPELLKEREEK